MATDSSMFWGYRSPRFCLVATDFRLALLIQIIIKYPLVACFSDFFFLLLHGKTKLDNRLAREIVNNQPAPCRRLHAEWCVQAIRWCRYDTG